MRKIDLRVIPFLCVLYLLAFLDRVNIANAKAFRLQEDLKLKKVEYNTALTIFFVPYIFFEIPSNILLKKLRPATWLSGCMFMFGIASIAQGLVTNYAGLLTTRFMLGLFEAGMFPGCFYLIGMWYKRSEAQRRYSFFFASTTLAGAFGGLLASVIGKMQGLRGYNGWRWIFILEGVLTVVVAIVFFFFIPSFPEDAKWLTPEEREYVKARLQVDQGKSAKERAITARDVGRVFKDYKVIIGGFMYFGMLVPVSLTSRSSRSRASDSQSLSGIRICILRAFNCQNVWLLSNPNAIIFRPAMGMRFRVLHDNSNMLRFYQTPLRIYHRPHLTCGSRLRHITRCPRQQQGALLSPLPHRHGRLLGHARHRMLVQYESRRSSSQIRRQRLANRLRKHRRHHCDLRVFGYRGPEIHKGIFTMSWVLVFGGVQLCAVCHCGGLGE